MALFMGVNAYAQNIEKSIEVIVSNDWKNDKADEPVVINLNKLDLGFTAKSVIVWDGDKEIPS